MPISCSPQPSTRRKALENLIEAAVSDGDSRRIHVLSGQWVHRYGLLSLPAAAASESLQLAPATPQSEVAAHLPMRGNRAEAEISGHDVHEAVEAEAAEVPPPADFEAEYSPSEPLAFDRDEPSGSDQDRVNAPVADPDQQDRSSSRHQIATRALTPPPLNTPRSLRRWLPGTDTSMPQAS